MTNLIFLTRFRLWIFNFANAGLVLHQRKFLRNRFTLSLLESIMETRGAVQLTFESVDKILWCDHSNETSFAVLLHGTICFSIFLQNEIWDFVFLEF